MTKRLLICSVAASLMLFVPSVVRAADAAPDPIVEVQPEDEDQNVDISVTGQQVLVSGAQGRTLEVVSLTGRRVMTVKIESPAQRIELNLPKGCYILKIGKVVRKVAIR